MEPGEVYSRVGEAGLTTLVAGFYRRVPADAILGPMYRAHSDLAEAELRLRGFLIYRFGGPPHYLETRGPPRLKMRHAPFVVDRAARDHWVALMDAALDEAVFPDDVAATVRTFLHETATFLINR